MWQELFRIPNPFGSPLVVHGFGLMLVIGFLCGMELARFLARRSNLNPDIFSNAALLALVTGILGARISHVFENWPEYTRADRSFVQNLVAAVNISSGGLTYYGGFLLAFPSLLIYGRMKRVPLPVGMDIIAPCLMVGLAFGRIGCFLNGCCYGAECDAPWAMRFPYASPAYSDQFDQGKIHPPAQLIVSDTKGEPALIDPHKLHDSEHAAARALAGREHSLALHPAQLYSAFTAFVLVALLLAHFTTPHAAGRTFALMLILESLGRFSLEMVRAEPAVWGKLSFSMVLSIPLFVLGVILWIAFGRDLKNAPEADSVKGTRAVGAVG